MLAISPNRMHFTTFLSTALSLLTTTIYANPTSNPSNATAAPANSSTSAISLALRARSSSIPYHPPAHFEHYNNHTKRNNHFQHNYFQAPVPSRSIGIILTRNPRRNHRPRFQQFKRLPPTPCKCNGLELSLRLLRDDGVHGSLLLGESYPNPSKAYEYPYR